MPEGVGWPELIHGYIKGKMEELHRNTYALVFKGQTVDTLNPVGNMYKLYGDRAQVLIDWRTNEDMGGQPIQENTFKDQETGYITGAWMRINKDWFYAPNTSNERDSLRTVAGLMQDGINVCGPLEDVTDPEFDTYPDKRCPLSGNHNTDPPAVTDFGGIMQNYRKTLVDVVILWQAWKDAYDSKVLANDLKYVKLPPFDARE
jgi:hypothetical protein